MRTTGLVGARPSGGGAEEDQEWGPPRRLSPRSPPRRSNTILHDAWGIQLSVRETGLYLCAVVKVQADDAFVLTAYLTDRIKRGVTVWPKNPDA